MTSASGVVEPSTCYSAGYIGTGTTFNVQPIAGVLAVDLILAQGNRNLTGLLYGTIDDLYLDGTQLSAYATVNLSNTVSSPVTGPFIYGTGSLNVLGKGFLSYPSGAGAAAAALLYSGATTINNQGKCCVSAPADAAAPSCNITLTPANLDTILGAQLGCCTVIGGGSICNISN